MFLERQKFTLGMPSQIISDQKNIDTFQQLINQLYPQSSKKSSNENTAEDNNIMIGSVREDNDDDKQSLELNIQNDNIDNDNIQEFIDTHQ